ncbi:MAG: IS110 family transposase [bacterium]|nr:IS110 family transposase [bacterium]
MEEATTEKRNPKPDHSDLTENQIRIRHAVGLLYDLQKLRIQSGNRTSAGVDTIELDEADRVFVGKLSTGLEAVEKDALKEVKRLLKCEPIWNAWIKNQKGVGPTMGGVLIAYINVHRAPTVSSVWKYCGLAVVNGQSDRRRKGEKCGYNPFLKAKMVEVLAGCLIKAKSPWKDIYDGRKNRRRNQLLDECMACAGTGKIKGAVCLNCKGKGGPAPWGKSDAHRERDARRVMVKLFLAELHTTWRTLEGLPVRPSYAEEYLGRKHHA